MSGTARVGAGVVDRKTAAATGVTESDLYYLGASVPLGGTTAPDKARNGVMAALRRPFRAGRGTGKVKDAVRIKCGIFSESVRSNVDLNR